MNASEYTIIERLYQWLVPDAAEIPDEYSRRALYISILICISAPLMLFFAYLEYSMDSTATMLIALSGAIALVITYLLIRNNLYEVAASRAAFAFMILLMCTFALLDRSVGELMHMLLIPVVAVFAFGVKEGFLWGITFLAAAVVLTLPAVGVELQIVESARVDFVAAYVVFFAFALGYEALRLKTQKVADDRNARLEQEHEHLLRVQSELSAKEKRFHQYADLASDWLVELDADMNVSYISDRFEEITGIPRDNALGIAFTDVLMRCEDVDIPYITEVMKNRQPFRDLSYTLSLPDERKIRVVARGEPLFDEEGTFKGYFTTGTDVTHLEQVHREIEDRDRTLQHIQRLDSLGQLTSGISHDFNNMMTVIRGNLELLKLTAKSASDKEAIRAIETASTNASELTSQLLEFARVQPESNVDLVDTRQSLLDFAQLIKRSIGEAIELDVIAPEDLMKCEVDQSQLESAILNLALNGRDAMQGKGLLTIAARNLQIGMDPGISAGSYVRISVIDEGCGIPADVLARVTDPFFTTKPDGTGTGLGLSMVNAFVVQSGGKMEIESAEGIGTSISLILPAAARTPHEHTDRDRTSLAQGHTPGCRILMVEDEANVQIIVARMLELLGHKVDICNNAEEALQLIREKEFDVLVTDMMLGAGLNGYELAIRLTTQLPDIKVVLMSGYPEKILSKHSEIKAGFELVRKPFGLEELQGALAKSLTG